MTLELPFNASSIKQHVQYEVLENDTPYMASVESSRPRNPNQAKFPFPIKHHQPLPIYPINNPCEVQLTTYHASHPKFNRSMHASVIRINLRRSQFIQPTHQINQKQPWRASLATPSSSLMHIRNICVVSLHKYTPILQTFEVKRINLFSFIYYCNFNCHSN